MCAPNNVELSVKLKCYFGFTLDCVGEFERAISFWLKFKSSDKECFRSFILMPPKAVWKILHSRWKKISANCSPYERMTATHPLKAKKTLLWKAQIIHSWFTTQKNYTSSHIAPQVRWNGCCNSLKVEKQRNKQKANKRNNSVGIDCEAYFSNSWVLEMLETFWLLKIKFQMYNNQNGIVSLLCRNKHTVAVRFSDHIVNFPIETVFSRRLVYKPLPG